MLPLILIKLSFLRTYFIHFIKTIGLTSKNFINHPRKIKLLEFLDRINNLCLPLPLFFSTVLALLAWLVESYLLYMLFQCFDVFIAYRQVALIRTAMGIGGVISFLPAGLITTETTSIALAIAYGAGRVEAIAATLFIRIYTLFIPFTIVLISFYFQKDLKFSRK